jgi:hypothetical protein
MLRYTGKKHGEIYYDKMCVVYKSRRVKEFYVKNVIYVFTNCSNCFNQIYQNSAYISYIA